MMQERELTAFKIEQMESGLHRKHQTATLPQADAADDIRQLPGAMRAARGFPPVYAGKDVHPVKGALTRRPDGGLA
jgi:hypothetical protein